MTTDETRALSVALKHLGDKREDVALGAARITARLLGASGVSPSVIAGAIATCIRTKTETQPARPFADLGPRSARKRMVAIARQRGLSAEDKARVTAMRDRLVNGPTADLSAEEIAWLEDLWREAAPTVARTRVFPKCTG